MIGCVEEEDAAAEEIAVVEDEEITGECKELAEDEFTVEIDNKEAILICFLKS